LASEKNLEDHSFKEYKKRKFQEFFEENITEKSIVFDDAYRRDKEEIERITGKSDILNNPLILAETYKNSIFDKDRYSPNKKDVFALSHWIYQEKDERIILEEVFQMLFSQETELFRLKKDDKYEYPIYFLKTKCQVAHLSPLALENILEEFIKVANLNQEILFLLNDLQTIFKGKIADGFLNSVLKIKNNFHKDVCNLQLIFLFHSYKCKKKFPIIFIFFIKKLFNFNIK